MQLCFTEDLAKINGKTGVSRSGKKVDCLGISPFVLV